MYEEYFSLKTKPFSIVPDPRYFFMSHGHKEALAHLLYGIGSEGGFVLLTGEVGTGKTTVCRRLLELMPEHCEVAFILNPKLTAEELLATVCDEFGISYPEGTTSIKALVASINGYLLSVHEKGRRAVLIIEEAQNLEPGVLEQIRLLTNLETTEHKLLQIIMVGQPELREMLSQPQLRQLSQRITARYHLGPLSKEEVAEYVNHRLSVAGLVRGRLFPPPTLRRLFRLSGGVPRLINVICDRALLGAYVQAKDRVDTTTLTMAAREVSGQVVDGRKRVRLYTVLCSTFVLLVWVALGTHYYYVHTAAHRPTAFVEAREPLGEEKKIETRAANLERPMDQTGSSTREAAYSELFKHWQMPYAKGDSGIACEQARKQGLQCVKSRGSLTDLQQINRPAVLTLVDEKDGEYYAALTSLRGASATLVVGDETRTVDVSEIVARWSGDYLILWRTPPDYKGTLKQGDSGLMVAWLEKELALAQGREGPAVRKPVFDAETVKRVKKFQLAAGLMPDGLAGPRTIMCLSAAAENGEPILAPKKGND